MPWCLCPLRDYLSLTKSQNLLACLLIFTKSLFLGREHGLSCHIASTLAKLGFRIDLGQHKTIAKYGPSISLLLAVRVERRPEIGLTFLVA